MAFKGLFSRKDTSSDAQKNEEQQVDSSGSSENVEESPADSDSKIEDVPDQSCRFCYEPFNNGDDTYKCPNCDTHYHYPRCLRNQPNCRVCGERIIEHENIVKLVNTLHAVCPNCQTKIQLEYSLEPKIPVNCSSCGRSGKLANPYLKAMEEKDDEIIEDSGIDQELIDDGTEDAAAGTGEEVISPGSVTPRKPKLVIMEESITCHVCLGAIKTGLPVVVCKCGKKYHESCANRVKTCPICDVDITDYDPVDDLVRSRSAKFRELVEEFASESVSEYEQELTPEPVEPVEPTGVETAPEPETSPEPEPATAPVTETPEPQPEEEGEVSDTDGAKFELNSSVTFENYLINDENRIVHSIAKGVAQAPGHEYRLLYMHGANGLGKTHLLQAIGNYVQNHKELKVEYAGAKQFFSTFDDALSSGKQKQFVAKFKDTDVILLDDLHEVSNSKSSQEKITKVFQNFLENDKQIVIAGDRPIEDMDSLEKNLANLFNDGLNVRLNTQGPELRKEILKKHITNESAKILNDLIDDPSKLDDSDLSKLKKEISKIIRAKEAK
jgi:Zn ribbon nucleic-acid-binding protein